MWYIGLDWADTHHDVEVMDQLGKRVGARRFAHSHEGLNAMKEFVLAIAPSPEQLACIVETNHGLLITFLLEAGIPVYPSIRKSLISCAKRQEPRPIRLMPICWQRWAALIWMNCADWSPIAPPWLS